MNFFSAREEPDQPKPPPKKAAAKKVTTAVLSERLGLLMSQVKVIAEQQEEMKRQQAISSATPVEGGDPGPPRAGMPSVSASLVSPPASAVKKAVGILGPPPKTKQIAYPPIIPVDPASQIGTGPAEVDENQPGWVNVLAQQGAALTALVAHLASGDALTDLQYRQQQFRAFCEYKRRCSARETTIRSCQSIQPVLPTSATTTSRASVPSPVDSQDRRGSAGKRCGPHHLPRTSWKFQRAKRTGLTVLDSCTQLRCSCRRGFSCNKGVLGAGSSQLRPSLPGRALASGLLAQPPRRASTPDVCRKSSVGQCSNKAVREPGSAQLGSHRSRIFEGSRNAQLEEERIQEGGITSRKSRSRQCCPEPTPQAKVSEEGQSGGWGSKPKLTKGLRSPGPKMDGAKMLLSSLHEGETPCPCDRWCVDPECNGGV